MFDKLLRNIVPVIFGFGFLLLLTFLFVLSLTGRDPEAYIGSITSLIGIIVSSGLIAALQTRVAKNTNGSQTALIEAVRVLTAERRETTDAPAPLSDERLSEIEDDANRLPSHK